MENIYEAGNLLICFPCWLIEHHNLALGGFLTVRNKDNEIAALIFTDSAAAEAYIDACPKPILFRNCGRSRSAGSTTLAISQYNSSHTA